MIEYDEIEQRLVLKLVYYGPALSGKTTNLLRLHDLLPKEGRGNLMVLDTKNDRTIYFDLLPFLLVAPSGLKIKLKAFTVPGQVQHDQTRKAVLQRADGVVFVADSRREEAANNKESFANLERNLSLVGLDVDRVPLVVQFNKRDLSDIVSEPDIRAAWASTGIPVTLASALEGWGVLETFRLAAEGMYDVLDRRFALANRHGLARAAFVERLTASPGGALANEP
jgi:signal recognition particle receptor subunit beta